MKRNILTSFVIFFALSLIQCTGKPYFMYYPRRELTSTPQDIGLNFKLIYFITDDNVRLSGWWVPSKKERGVVLFSHGNSGNISNRLASINIFHEMNLSVFIYDYRGYGKSEGAPTEEGTYMDAKAAWDYLVKKRKIAKQKIIIFGRSLGGSIAAWLAQNHTPRILIIESSFTSLAEVSKLHYSCFPGELVFGDCYSTGEYIKNIKSPVLIIHSTDDELTPFSQGKKLFELANKPKEFIILSGSHNTGFLESIKEYKAGLHSFVNRFIK